MMIQDSLPGAWLSNLGEERGIADKKAPVPQVFTTARVTEPAGFPSLEQTSGCLVVQIKKQQQ